MRPVPLSPTSADEMGTPISSRSPIAEVASDTVLTGETSRLRWVPDPLGLDLYGFGSDVLKGIFVICC